MTPGEYKNGGENLSIRYHFAESPFGTILTAATSKGICHMAFVENQPAGKMNAFETLKSHFPKASFEAKNDALQQNVMRFFTQEETAPVKLHLKGTDFQLKVWESLLKIPSGALSTYGQIAANIQNPNASRAVGTAIGSNPVAFLIPCHRVIQSTGVIGGYMWGTTRKTAIIGWENAQKLRTANY